MYAFAYIEHYYCKQFLKKSTPETNNKKKDIRSYMVLYITFAVVSENLVVRSKPDHMTLSPNVHPPFSPPPPPTSHMELHSLDIDQFNLPYFLICPKPFRSRVKTQTSPSEYPLNGHIVAIE